MKVAIPFGVGGGGGGSGVSEEIETLGEAPPPLNDRLPRTVNYTVFLFRDPPLPEFLDPPLKGGGATDFLL